MTVVDAHHHLWDLARNPLPWLDGQGENPLRRNFLLGDLLDELDGTGVKQTICVQAGITLQESRWLFEVGNGGSPIAGVVAQADLGDPQLATTLAELRQCPGAVPLVGLRDPTLVRRYAQNAEDSWSSGLTRMRHIGLPIDLLTPAGTLAAAARLTREHPELTFVMDHLGQPPVVAGGAALRNWATDLATVAQGTNVVCKLSGLRPEWAASHGRHLRFVVESAFELFGPARLMFGSDWPVSPLAGGYRACLEMMRGLLPMLSRDESASFWGGTAGRVYGLTPGTGGERATRSG
jgi:L-fuconolactonase